MEKTSSRLKEIVSIISAEISAILFVTEYISHRRYKKAIILIDSHAACKYLWKTQVQDVYNSILLNICIKDNVIIQWITAHVGNEIADTLVKDALSRNKDYENQLLFAIQIFKRQKILDLCSI